MEIIVALFGVVGSVAAVVQTAIAWRSSLAHLLGILGAILFLRSTRAEVRFHAAQSLWIDILAIVWFVLSFILIVIYSAISYPADATPAATDPFMLTWFLTAFTAAPLLHLISSILVLARAELRIPFIWRVAHATLIRQAEK